MIKLFVDDYRSQPDGWHLVKTITEAIRSLSGPLYCEVVSLDHDIIFETTNCKVGFSNETFASVARYIAIMPKDRLPKIVYIHTANPTGAKDIEKILLNIVTTKILLGSYDLSRFEYKDKLIKLECERENSKIR
jgi:hypothetical protein